MKVIEKRERFRREDGEGRKRFPTSLKRLAKTVFLRNLLLIIDNKGVEKFYDITLFNQIKNKRRNIEVIRHFIKGETYENIGRKFDLSRERVRQIINSYCLIYQCYTRRQEGIIDA